MTGAPILFDQLIHVDDTYYGMRRTRCGKSSFSSRVHRADLPATCLWCVAWRPR